jgi:hypothetical protein
VGRQSPRAIWKPQHKAPIFAAVIGGAAVIVAGVVTGVIQAGKSKGTQNAVTHGGNSPAMNLTGSNVNASGNAPAYQAGRDNNVTINNPPSPGAEPRLLPFAGRMRTCIYKGESPIESLVAFFNMEVLNNGSNSSMRDWRLDVMRPGEETIYGLLWSKPSKEVLNALECEWLPDLPAANPIVHGGRAEGCVAFFFPPSFTLQMLEEPTVIFRVSFRDVNDKLVSCDYRNSELKPVTIVK